MTTTTIHVEDHFAEVLCAFVVKKGTSVNQAIKAILSPGLGVGNESKDGGDPYSE